MMSKEEWAWLAGFFDGEGCIQILQNRSGSYLVRLSLSQRDPEPIDKIHQMVGGLRYRCQVPRGMRHDWVMVKYSDVIRVLLGMAPYLVVKRTQAEVVLTYKPNRASAQLVKKLRKANYA